MIRRSKLSSSSSVKPVRPVDRGAPPGGYARYQDAAPDLRERLGGYCSYCERRIETHLAVEHIRPKSVVSALSSEWTNLLLACVNCNSSKGDVQVCLDDYFWPDSDNTLRAFEYVRGGLIRRRQNMSPTMTAKAMATLQLTGLDRDPGSRTTAKLGRSPVVTPEECLAVGARESLSTSRARHHGNA